MRALFFSLGSFSAVLYVYLLVFPFLVETALREPGLAFSLFAIIRLAFPAFWQCDAKKDIWVICGAIFRPHVMRQGEGAKIGAKIPLGSKLAFFFFFVLDFSLSRNSELVVSKLDLDVFLFQAG